MEINISYSKYVTFTSRYWSFIFQSMLINSNSDSIPKNVYVFVLQQIGARMASKEQETYARAGQLAEQVLAAIKTVFAFNGSDFESKRYNKIFEFVKS